MSHYRLEINKSRKENELNQDRARARAEMTRALSLLLADGQVTEIRALDARNPSFRSPHVISGYFTEVEALVDAADTITDAKGIYVIPNPI